MVLGVDIPAAVFAIYGWLEFSQQAFQNFIGVGQLRHGLLLVLSGVLVVVLSIVLEGGWRGITACCIQVEAVIWEHGFGTIMLQKLGGQIPWIIGTWEHWVECEAHVLEVLICAIQGFCWIRGGLVAKKSVP